MKTLLISLLSFAGGLVVCYGLYWLLDQSLGENLTGQEETVFKAVYVVIVIGSAVLALGLGYLFAKLAKVTWEWVLVEVIFLITVAAMPFLAVTSYANDCRWAIEWPLKVAGCD